MIYADANSIIIAVLTDRKIIREGIMFYTVIKRAFDILFAIFAIVFLFPLFIIISLAIKIDSKGPILFRHKRIGYNGKEINIYKFRTMVENAEDLFMDFAEEEIKEWKENYKIANDPRMTRIGRVLRKTSLDELPQLIDIIAGRMSFVGPRPVIEEELHDKWTPEQQVKLLSVLPGLTGYWASHGRSNTSYSERIEMELYYVDHASLWLDIKILFLTVPNVLFQRGAN